MEYEKSKKLRKFLINYSNQQLKINKNKKFKILLNSISLEEFEKKNLYCKEFCIVEKPQIYQNIDNNRSIVQNIYINNNSFISNIVIYPLSSRIISSKNIINMGKIYNNNLNIRYINNNPKEKNERIFKELSKKTISRKQKEIESPIRQSRLIKKHLGERKLKKTKNDINFNNYNSVNKNILFNKDKNKKKKEKNEIKNKIELCKGMSKQFSIETLATEISRIIKITHNYKNINSLELSHSSSKIEENAYILKAKKYAKKLKYYCRTLKNKYPSNENIIQLKSVNRIDTEDKLFNYDISLDNNIKEEKTNYHKIKNKKNNIKERVKRIHSNKFCAKIKENENENRFSFKENVIKHLLPNKKIKSERNLKAKLNKNALMINEDIINNNTERIINKCSQYKTIDNDSKTKNRLNSSFFINNMKKNKKITDKEEVKQIPKKNTEIIKSPLKTKKKEIMPNLLIRKIKNKIIYSKRESKRITKNKNNNKNNNEDSQKNDSPFISKNIRKKRNSIDTRMIGDGGAIETIFFSNKNLSISEEFNLSKKKNFDLNNKHNNNTINELESISPSHKKKPNKQKNKLTLSKKTNNNKKKDRRLSFFNNVLENSLYKSIDIGHNKKKEKVKKRTIKLDEEFIINKKEICDTQETDDYNNYNNILDEYLYKKRHKKKGNIQQ